MIGPVYPYRGGIAHYTTALAIALENAGHAVKVFSFKRQYPSFLYPGETDKDPSANPVHLEAEYLLDPLHPWTWRQTAKAILADGSQLVLIQWWTTFWGFAFASLTRQLQKKVKLVFLIHNLLPHESRIWDKWLARMALSRASAFIVQSLSEQKKLLDLIPNARISFCSHPIYQRFNKQIIPQAAARQSLGLPMDQPVVLFFGIVRPYKGLKYLIEAIYLANSQVHLVIGGEFWQDVELFRRQIDSLGLTSRVTLVNKYIPDEEAHLLFSSADVLVAPYVGGTQSGAVELARGYGLPIILSDRIASGVDDLNDHALHVVPAGNVTALATAIDEAVKNLANRAATQIPGDDWNRMVKIIEQTQARLL